MQNTVMVAGGENTTLRNIFCVKKPSKNKYKKNIGAARLGQPLADRYSRPVLKPVRLTIRCN